MFTGFYLDDDDDDDVIVDDGDHDDDDVNVDDGDHHDDNDDQVQAERLPWRAASAKNSSAERLMGEDKWDGGMTMIRINSDKDPKYLKYSRCLKQRSTRLFMMNLYTRCWKKYQS